MRTSCPTCLTLPIDVLFSAGCQSVTLLTISWSMVESHACTPPVCQVELLPYPSPQQDGQTESNATRSRKILRAINDNDITIQRIISDGAYPSLSRDQPEKHDTMPQGGILEQTSTQSVTSCNNTTLLYVYSTREGPELASFL